MQVVLVMFRPGGERRSFSVARDMTVIGRREDCDLRIPLGEVSRKHCRLIKDGDSLRLEDLGSSNGTFHNGQRVQETIIGAGDTVQVGPIIFGVQIDGYPADEDLRPTVATAADQTDRYDSPAEAAAEPAEEAEVVEEAEVIEEAEVVAEGPEVTQASAPISSEEDFEIVLDPDESVGDSVQIRIDGLGDSRNA